MLYPGEEDVANAFSLDELKLKATTAVAVTGTSTAEEEETENVPLRRHGWYVPYQQAAIDEEEEETQRNVSEGLAEGPSEAYCYMCSSWDARQHNPLRKSVQMLIDRAVDMAMPRVVRLISKYYVRWVQPRTHKHWSINSIRDHLTQHVINPRIMLTENIRGLQCFMDAHLAVAETVTTTSTADEKDEKDNNDYNPGGGTRSRPNSSSRSRTPSVVSSSSDRPTKRRKINSKETETYMKLVRTQASLITLRERMNMAQTGGDNSTMR